MARFGTDAVRWWFLRDVARVGDTDYTPKRLVARANEDLANSLGNLVNRTVAMVTRYRDGRIPVAARQDDAAGGLLTARTRAADEIDAALDDFDFRRALAAIITVVDEANRYINAVEPWELAKAERNDGAPQEVLDAVLSELVATCRELGEHLRPFLPSAAQRIAEQCGSDGNTVAPPTPVFPRLEL